MKNIIVALIFMIIYITSYSQVTGLVFDEEGNPINKADVFLADENILLSTNLIGEFNVNQKLSNNSYIHISKYGFHSQLFKYQNGQDLKIILEKLHVDLDEVGVVESFYQLGSSKLTNIEKKKINLLSSSSMVESITDLSGVDMISSGLGIQKIVVRGLSGMRVVTYLNGMKINNQQWANDHGIGFTELGLGEVELIKGSSALKYGSEAIGGVLFFKDEPFNSNEKFSGYVATKFNNSSYLSSSQFGFKWNKKNLYINLYSQYSISADYRLPNNEYLFNSRFKQDAIKFSVAHRIKKIQNIFRYQLHTEITGIPAHVHAGDPTQIAINQVTSDELHLPWAPIEGQNSSYKPTRPTQFINNQLLTYESNYITDNLKLTLHAGYFINNLTEYDKWTIPAFDLTIKHSQLMPNIRYHFDDLIFNVGSSFSFLENTNGDGEDKLVPDVTTMNIGPYFILDYEKNNIGFNAGVRHDYKIISSEDTMLVDNYENVFSNFSSSSGIYYKYTDHIFRATYSGAFRAPDFSELFSDGVHHGTNRYEIGDRNLKIEYSNQIDFKYQWSNNHLGFVLNPFVQYISDFITINPLDSFSDNKRVYEYTQFEKVKMSGIEMNVHYHPHQLHNLHFEQSYSFLKTENNDSDFGLALTPANCIKTKLLLDLNSLTSYNNFFSPVLKTFNYISLNHTYKFKQESFAEYEELTEDYNIINLQLSLKFGNCLRSTISVNNLLNEEYSPHISRIRGVAGGIPNPGRFLNINLKYEF